MTDRRLTGEMLIGKPDTPVVRLTGGIAAAEILAASGDRAPTLSLVPAVALAQAVAMNLDERGAASDLGVRSRAKTTPRQPSARKPTPSWSSW